MKISVETNPKLYKFYNEIVIRSIEEDGESYLNKLMHHFSNYNFKIMNGSYERDITMEDRLGNSYPSPWHVIDVRMNVERIVEDIHSPKEYIKNILHQEIYDTFALFLKNVLPNDDKFDYVKWINDAWDEWSEIDNIEHNDLKGEDIINEPIKLGITKNETTNFENLICPHCHSYINWDTFYSDVDPHDTLSTDASATNEYICPECGKPMRVCLDVLVLAEKL